ncbi:TonB-dependent receptor [Pusillimonas sp.]|uniref:TonB-dependent receptor n=1 Tax=Pusillimonas sp. TaxID=3040095 RepID=UPI0037CB7FAF
MKLPSISTLRRSIMHIHTQGAALCHLPLLAATALCPLAALAQSQPTQGQAATLAPITVSSEQASTLDRPAQAGSNLNLTPRETPASIDVIDRNQLETRGDHGIAEAVTRAGGISAMGHPGNGGSSFSTRGFTDSTSVMRLYDGLRQYGGVGVTFPFDTWSVDRIEVLRGPASVIYGDGAIGGVVNVVPRQPRHGPVENELQATMGTDSTARLGLDSSGSISDTVSYRLDLSGNRSDNWVDRAKSRDATFSGALQWEATRDLSLKLSHAYGYQKPMAYFGTPLIDGRQVDALREKNYNVDDGVIRYRDQWTELDALWTPSDSATIRAKLYHIRSKRHWHNAERYVHDPASGMIDRSDNTEIHHDQRQTGFTANAAFEGQLGDLPNTFSIGFDVNRSRFQHNNNNYFGSADRIDPYDPEPGYFHSGEPTIPRYRNEALQYALFMENRLKLTSRWAVIAGLRYDHADVHRDDLVQGARTLDRSYSNIGYRLGMVYDIDPGLALYAQYSQAADPVSGLLMLSPANAQFEMAKGKQIEIGLKQSFWQDAGEWTLAAYQIKKTNLLSRDPSDPSQRVQVGGQSSRGLEASLKLEFARNWSVQANGAILRARFDDFDEPLGSSVVSRKGRVPPNVAQKLANVWLSWNFQPGWTAMGGIQYVGKRYADNANTLELPSYTSTDLALRWQASKQTTLTARGYNVFDRPYFTTAYYTATQWLYGPGRRFELTLNHRF